MACDQHRRGLAGQPAALQGSGVAAEFAELAVGLLLTGAAIRVTVHGRPPARA